MTLNVAEIVISATDNTKQGFDSARAAVDTLKEHSLHLVEALGVGMFAEMIKGSMETADQLNKMSQSTGVSVESLSRLSLSAKLSDVDMETLAKGMEKLSKNINDASQGTGKAAGAFDYLGISVKDSQGHLKNSDAIMAEVADKFAGLQDGAGKTALAMDIFGKAGAGMIPMLNKGSEELKANAEMSDRLGLTLSGQTARSAEEVNDRFTLMGEAAHGIANVAMTQLLPTIDKISKMFVDNATDADNLRKKFAVLDGAIKSLITVGVIVKDVFAEIGTMMGGVMAAAALALSGDFSGAKDALKNMSTDMVDTMSKDMESITRLWTDNEPKATAAAEDAAKKTIDGYGAAAKAAGKAVKDQAYIDTMAALEADMKEKVFYGQKHQKNLDMQLANMLLSEKDFSAAKKQLVLDDLAQERSILESELLLARSKNDSKKAIEIEGRMERNKIAQEEASGPTAYDAKANKAAMSALELEKKAYQDRLDLAAAYRKNNGDADGRAKQMEYQAQVDHDAQMTALIKKGAVTRNDFEQMSGQQQLQTHLGLLSNLLSASATHSRAAFEAMKVVKLAEAAIALPSTVMKAYESGMEAGGPFGPAVGAAYAGLAFAAQMIQMNSIASASFGGSASAAPPSSGGSMASSSVPGQVVNPNVLGANAQPSQPVNVYVQGNVMTADFINNTVIPQIQSQVKNADVTLIDPRSRQAQMLMAGA